MIIVLSVLAYIICGILFGAIVQYCARDIGIPTDDDLMRAICIFWPISLLISIFFVITETGINISRMIGNWLFTIFHKKS